MPKIGQALGDTFREIKKVPDYKDGAETDSNLDSDSGEVKKVSRQDDLANLKDLARLGTSSGRRSLLGRWISKRF